MLRPFTAVAALPYNLLCRPFQGLAEEVYMQDAVFMLVLLAFFSAAALFVVACDRIIGPDEDALADSTRGAPSPGVDERVAA